MIKSTLLCNPKIISQWHNTGLRDASASKNHKKKPLTLRRMGSPIIVDNIASVDIIEIVDNAEKSQKNI